jgi:hypothetical protein
LDIGLGGVGAISSGDMVQVVADWSGPNQKWKMVEVTP